MKKIMKEAHKLTKEMKAKYPEINYQTQLGLFISYLLEEKKTQSTKRRNYGSFSKKQIGVIYAANKKGNIKVSNDFISTLYGYYVDLKGYEMVENYNKNSVICDKVADTIDAIFNNDYAEAQRCIDMAQMF